jgi:hypothetical protein
MSGMRVSIGMAKKMKSLRSSNGIPDLIILEPVAGFHGLLIELKIDDEIVIRRDGKLTADKHIQEQSMMIMRLRDRGFCAYFCKGTDAAVNLIEKYMSGAIHVNDIKRGLVEWNNTAIPGADALKID